MLGLWHYQVILKSAILEDTLTLTSLSAVLSLGFLHFVFGVETTLRVLKITPFKARYRVALIFNIVLFVGLILSTFGIAKALGFSQDKCLGSIAFRTASLQLNRGIIGAISIIIVSCLTMASILAVQLLR